MEYLRIVLRKVIPLSVYRGIAQVLNFLIILFTNPHCIGPLFIRRRAINVITPRGIVHPFRFRDSPHDRNVVIQNLIRKECLPAGVHPRYVLDAGGYIGDSAALYLSTWPECICVVLEPSSNHELAAANLAPYGDRVILRRAFLGRTPGFGSIEEAGVGSRISASKGDIPVISIEQVLALIPGGRVNVVKIDIEGAEVELLRPPLTWIDKVDMIVIELHGPEIEVIVRPWMAQYGFVYKKLRSLHFFVRPTPAPA